MVIGSSLFSCSPFVLVVGCASRRSDHDYDYEHDYEHDYDYDYGHDYEREDLQSATRRQVLPPERAAVSPPS